MGFIRVLFEIQVNADHEADLYQCLHVPSGTIKHKTLGLLGTLQIRDRAPAVIHCQTLLHTLLLALNMMLV